MYEMNLASVLEACYSFSDPVLYAMVINETPGVRICKYVKLAENGIIGVGTGLIMSDCAFLNFSLGIYYKPTQFHFQVLVQGCCQADEGQPCLFLVVCSSSNGCFFLG